jgi:addiction module HigA family antidote
VHYIWSATAEVNTPSTLTTAGVFVSFGRPGLKARTKRLALVIGVPANRVSQIVAGKRNISADTALRLGRLFGTGPHFWLNLQTAYELDLARLNENLNLAAIAPLMIPASNFHSAG